MINDKTKEIKINLSEEMFLEFLKGKKLNYTTNEYSLTIWPPHHGVYLTRSKIEELIRKACRDGMMDMAKDLSMILGDL